MDIGLLGVTIGHLRVRLITNPPGVPGLSLLTRTVGGSFCRQGQVSRVGWGGVDRN